MHIRRSAGRSGGGGDGRAAFRSLDVTRLSRAGGTAAQDVDVGQESHFGGDPDGDAGPGGKAGRGDE